MKKIVIFLVLALSFVWAGPLRAEVTMTGLIINEEIVPGPEDIILTASAVLSNGNRQFLTGDMTWTSSNHNVATVTAGGRVHFTGKPGPLTISVYKNGFSASKTVTVRSWPLSLDIETPLVYSTNPYRLLVKASCSDGQTRYLDSEDNLQWTSSNPWVAWVNNGGVVTFTGEAGYVSIKVVAGQYSDEVYLTVDEGADPVAWRTGIYIAGDVNYSPAPQELTLMATLTDGSEEELPNEAADWSSSNTTVASVNDRGIITFTGQPGYTTISVSYGSLRTEKLVAVQRFLEGLTINQSLNFTPDWEGNPIQLSATAKYNDGNSFIQSAGLTWSVDNKKVATITANGVLTFTGAAGNVTVSVSGKGYGETTSEDKVSLTVPVYSKPTPSRLFIDVNPLSSEGVLTPRVMCLFSDGSRKDVTNQAAWQSYTPDTASYYLGKLYLAPSGGNIRVGATYQGLSDQVSGYAYDNPEGGGRIVQLRIKEHGVVYSFTPLQLTGVAIKGNGQVENVTGNLRWRSSQAQVVRVNNGLLTFTGRTGKAVITAEGYGFRDQLSIEVRPEDLQPRVEKLALEGALNRIASPLKALAYFNDGTIKDVTTETVWNTSNKNIAVVAANGVVMFSGSLGPVEITANYRGKEAKIARS